MTISLALLLLRRPAPALAAWCLASTFAGAAPAQTVNFAYTGAVQYYTAPPGVVAITMTAKGGKGGNGTAPGTGSSLGGSGAATSCQFAVTPGMPFVILVGGAGGTGSFGLLGGGGGGGASYVAVGTDESAFFYPWLVAGGGGGAGHSLTLPTTSVAGQPGGATLGGSGNGGFAMGLGSGGAGVFGVGLGSAGGWPACFGGAGGWGTMTGGYGGGGGSSFREGGGGGGYTGGNGQVNTTRAVGGTSYCEPQGVNVVNTPGGNLSANGSVSFGLVYASASSSESGVGCGAVPLHMSCITQPAIGTTCTTMLSDVPATAQFAAMGMGLSNQMSGATPLPFDLGALGAPSCFLHNDMSLGAFTLGGSGAQVQFGTALPPQTAFVGLPLFQQGWCYDPTANGLGILTSNSLNLVVGL